MGGSHLEAQKTGQAFHLPNKNLVLTLSEQMSTGHGVALVIFEKNLVSFNLLRFWADLRLASKFKPMEVFRFLSNEKCILGY